jgi:hypothetical protein
MPLAVVAEMMLVPRAVATTRPEFPAALLTVAVSG